MERATAFQRDGVSLLTLLSVLFFEGLRLLFGRFRSLTAVSECYYRTARTGGYFAYLSKHSAEGTILLLFLSGRTEARGGGARSSLSAPSAPFLLPPFRFALVSVFADGRKGKSKVFNLAFGGYFMLSLSKSLFTQ